MIELSLSFLAWLGVLFIQALVHIKVVYLRRLREEDEEPRIIERESSASATEPETNEGIRKSILARSSSNPALDDADLNNLDFQDDDDDDDYDDPPNLEQRLSQTGSEMMSSCKSIEFMVQEQILAPQILAQ